jgi:hypothetical protein
MQVRVIVDPIGRTVSGLILFVDTLIIAGTGTEERYENILRELRQHPMI